MKSIKQLINEKDEICKRNARNCSICELNKMALVTYYQDFTICELICEINNVLEDNEPNCYSYI